MRADASGGWIASATDLLKLIVNANGFSPNDNILDSTTMSVMFSSSKPNEHFACGWFLNDDFKNRFNISEHFDQTSEIVRTSDGFSWIVLINTSRPAAEDYFGALD